MLERIDGDSVRRIESDSSGNSHGNRSADRDGTSSIGTIDSKRVEDKPLGQLGHLSNGRSVRVLSSDIDNVAELN